MPEFEKQQQRNTCWLISSSAPEWTRQAWMGFTSVSCLMDACALESALMQHWKWRTGSVDAAKAKLVFVSKCHTSWNVTIASYGGAGEKSPAPRASINIFGKINSFHSILKLKNPPFDLFFGLVKSSVVWPSEDNHYTFSIFTNFSSINIRSCWYRGGSKNAAEIHFIHRKPNGLPMNKMKKIKR